MLSLKCFINHCRGSRALCAAGGSSQVESGGAFGHGAKQRATSSPVPGSSQLNDVRRRHFAVPHCKAKTREAVMLLHTVETLNQNVSLLHHNFSGSICVL